ncbi:hypothetical protein F9222_25045 [Escherichia coli]|nr:hypothetical protein F9222_25045 [Escherichia coli]
MNDQVEGLYSEIEKINQESNLIVRFFLKLEFLFKYEKFPPVGTAVPDNWDTLSLYNSIIRTILDAPSKKSDSCIKITDKDSVYDLVYLKCTNMWSVEQRSISNGNISRKIPVSKTITHQEMLKFMGVQPGHISASNYSTSIKQSFESNQRILQQILNSNSVLNTFFNGLLCRSDELSEYHPEKGHKFTVGDVCGSPVTMLLAGYASGTLKMKSDKSETEFMTDFMNEYKKLIMGWKDKPDQTDRNKMSTLASKLMAELQPVVSEPLASDEHSGLLFLGDNINDRMDSDYETQARVIGLLSSAGAEFLRGNHDSFDFSVYAGILQYNCAKNEHDKRIVVQLRNFFLPALYVSETNTLYTHNGVKLAWDGKKIKVLYAFPELDGIELNGEKETYGEQICKYITDHYTYYNDNICQYIRNKEPWEANIIKGKTPTNFRPFTYELNLCAKKLNIKQVAGHVGVGLQSEGDAIRINGFKRIDGKLCMVPIAAITGK